MGRRIPKTLCVLSIAYLIAIVVGCASNPKVRTSFARTPTLLFGKEPSAALATRIGREPWPATAGRVESVEDTVYLEYYRDYFGGNNWQELNNPQRQFRSYRLGAQQR